MSSLGKCTWMVPEGYIPSRGLDSDALQSHETLCVLNAGDEDAELEITLYFGDRDPLGPYHRTVPARRTQHIRTNDLEDPEVPRDTDYATVVASSVPIVVQHSRLDSRRESFALLSTMAFPAG